MLFLLLNESSRAAWLCLSCWQWCLQGMAPCLAHVEAEHITDFVLKTSVPGALIPAQGQGRTEQGFRKGIIEVLLLYGPQLLHILSLYFAVLLPAVQVYSLSKWNSCASWRLWLKFVFISTVWFSWFLYLHRYLLVPVLAAIPSSPPTPQDYILEISGIPRAQTAWVMTT